MILHIKHMYQIKQYMQQYALNKYPNFQLPNYETNTQILLQ